VAPGRFRPGAPTDPYVRTLAHTVPLIMDSLRVVKHAPSVEKISEVSGRFANAAIRSCFVDTITEFRCIRRVAQKRSHESASRFPPLAPAGCCSPASSVLSRRYDALLPSRRTSFPSLGGTSVALVRFAPWRTSAPPEPGVGNPVTPSGNAEERTGFSQVPGEPRLSVCTCSKPTPAGLLAPDH